MTLSEYGVIGKVGLGAARAVLAESSKSPLSWPETFESLLELHSIVYEWCERAANANDYIKAKVNDEALTADLRIREMFSRVNLSGPYVEEAYDDIREVLHPKTPLLYRWQKSSRRRAARRSLRSVLQVYFPEFLRRFEDAIESRYDFATGPAREFDRLFSSPWSESQITEIVAEMASSEKDLFRAWHQLDRIITEFYFFSGLPRELIESWERGIAG
ncbi:hypothetical protein REH65_32310 [Saccharopolyspora sp. ID03-671]|uniref:hypothetical protein n=1 Tax=Saccharopolyspora sp. ID03-671 TaxID=3073066 RepID=UPI00324662C0